MGAESGRSRTLSASTVSLLVPAIWLALACFLPPSLLAQDNPTSEMTTQDSDPTFKLQVERNLVLVRVVVSNSQGKVSANLTKEDFRLTDNGKPQVLSHFAMEIPSE